MRLHAPAVRELCKLLPAYFPCYNDRNCIRSVAIGTGKKLDRGFRPRAAPDAQIEQGMKLTG